MSICCLPDRTSVILIHASFVLCYITSLQSLARNQRSIQIHPEVLISISYLRFYYRITTSECVVPLSNNMVARQIGSSVSCAGRDWVWRGIAVAVILVVASAIGY